VIGAVTIGLLLVAVAVAVVGHTSSHRTNTAIEIALLRDARRGDAVSYRSTSTVTRRIAGQAGLSAVVERWVREDPPLIAIHSGQELLVRTDTGAWVCEELDGGPSCLPSSNVEPITSAARPYIVALASGRYDVVPLPDRTIAGESASCYSLQLRRGQEALDGLGARLDTCFARDGVVLSTLYDHGDGVVDEQVVTELDRGLSGDDLRALGQRLSDGSVPPLAGR
jgi:hypothetical protein